MNKAERNFLNGQISRLKTGSYHPLYGLALSIYRRCTEKKYKYYYGKIKFKFSSILKAAEYIESLGPRPSKKHSIDRINNKGHYEPGNLRWATQSQQMHNQNRKSKLGIQGVTLIKRVKGNSYYAQIKYEGKMYYLGIFKTAKEASLIYQIYANILYGESK